MKTDLLLFLASFDFFLFPLATLSITCKSISSTTSQHSVLGTMISLSQHNLKRENWVSRYLKQLNFECFWTSHELRTVSSRFLGVSGVNFKNNRAGFGSHFAITLYTEMENHILFCPKLDASVFFLFLLTLFMVVFSFPWSLYAATRQS